MTRGRTLDLTRSALTVMRDERRLALVPLAAFSLLSVLAVGAAALVRLTLQPRVRVFGSAYNTAGFGVADARNPSPSAVTTIVPTAATFAVLVAAYLLAAVVVTGAVALVAAHAHQRLLGERPSLARAAALVVSRAPQLLAWAAFGGLVGVAHRVIEKRAVLGALTGRGPTASWRRASWLALPAVVLEGRGPVSALVRSSELLEETWGEEPVGRTGLGAVAAVLFVPAAAVLLAGPGGPVGLALTAALAAGATAVAVTMSAITRTAVFAHATGADVTGYDADALAGAFRSRRPRCSPTPAPTAEQLALAA
jgi:hypothetical protein